MNRRDFLKFGAAAAGVGVSGCLSDHERGDPVVESPPEDDTPLDGYPPEFDRTPDERQIDTASFETNRQDGVDVPLAPIDVVEYWYFRGEARFADARGSDQFSDKHILGAVLSPASGGGGSDPVTDWPTSDTIVLYCGCPHHLSSIRAADLIENGYEEVYVIDEGFWEWYERGLPVAGDSVSSQPAASVIEGVTDAGHSGETAWARHTESDQVEATGIGGDGEYTLHLYFDGINPESVIEVETPEYTVRGPLRQLTDETVRGRE